jgi:hypothetical protein
MVSSVLDEETVSTLPMEPVSVTVPLPPLVLPVTWFLLLLPHASTEVFSALETVFVSMELATVPSKDLVALPTKELLVTFLSTHLLSPAQTLRELETVQLVWLNPLLLVLAVLGAPIPILPILINFSPKDLVLKITSVETFPSTPAFLLKTS